MTITASKRADPSHPVTGRAGQQLATSPVVAAGLVPPRFDSPAGAGHPQGRSSGCSCEFPDASVSGMLPEPEEQPAQGARWLTPKQICERFQIEMTTVRYWRRTGTGPQPSKVGRHLRYPLDEVERYEREIREESRRQQSA